MMTTKDTTRTNITKTGTTQQLNTKQLDNSWDGMIQLHQLESYHKENY